MGLLTCKYNRDDGVERIIGFDPWDVAPKDQEHPGDDLDFTWPEWALDKANPQIEVFVPYDPNVYSRDNADKDEWVKKTPRRTQGRYLVCPSDEDPRLEQYVEPRGVRRAGDDSGA